MVSRCVTRALHRTRERSRAPLVDGTIFPPSKRTKSEVWSYFGYFKNSEVQLVEDGAPVCRTCRRKVSAKRSKLHIQFDHSPTRPSPAAAQPVQGIFVILTHSFSWNARNNFCLRVKGKCNNYIRLSIMLNLDNNHLHYISNAPALVCSPFLDGR